MIISDFIIELYFKVDNSLPYKVRDMVHKQRSLSPSEIITIGLLFSIKGGKGRSFYRWLSDNFIHFFPNLPDRTNLFRLMNTFSKYARAFMSVETLFGVADSYGIELIHPKRENRSKNQIGKKGKSNHRWIVGVKVCPILNKFGLVVDWEVATANVCDNYFQPLLKKYEDKMIIFADGNFKKKENNAENIKFCKRGSCNERMIVEIIFSMISNLSAFKKLYHRKWAYLNSRIAYTLASFNILCLWDGINENSQGIFQLSIAKFSF